jgi:hypothetical protein
MSNVTVLCCILLGILRKLPLIRFIISVMHDFGIT